MPISINRESSRFAEAEEPFRKAVKYNPSDKGARDLLKRCLDYLGK